MRGPNAGIQSMRCRTTLNGEKCGRRYSIVLRIFRKIAVRSQLKTCRFDRRVSLASCVGRDAEAFSLLPKNVHQPWPLALKSKKARRATFS